MNELEKEYIEFKDENGEIKKAEVVLLQMFNYNICSF